jgi:hypothetical protein
MQVYGLIITLDARRRVINRWLRAGMILSRARDLGVKGCPWRCPNEPLRFASQSCASATDVINSTLHTSRLI